MRYRGCGGDGRDGRDGGGMYEKWWGVLVVVECGENVKLTD